MKKFLLALTIILASVGVVACGQSDENEYSDYNYLSLEINPAIDLVIDKNGNVHTYQLRNEAAEIVAAGLELAGKNYEEALQLYLNAAIDTGYIDISREDGALMIQVGGKNDSDNNAFMIQVENKLQTFLQENAVGAVILKLGEMNDEVKEFAETNDVSYGIAKMMMVYLEENEDKTVEDVLEMSPSDIMENLIEKANQYRERYQNQIQAGAQAIKDELVEALSMQVEAHRQAVLDGTKTQPDVSNLKTMYQQNFQSMHQEYLNRNQTRLQEAKNNVSEQAPMFFSVDINPGIDFVVDFQGQVLSYHMRNEAAEIVAAGLDFEGMQFQEALRLYLDAAVQTGYIDLDRADNAVMIQNSGVNSELENQFRNQTQTMMQTYFSENAIGAVVLNKNEIDAEIREFAETHDISYGFAQLVITYLDTDEALILEDVLEMKPADIIKALNEEYGLYLSRYRNQVEAGAQAIKDDLVEALRLRVQEHKDAVTQGEISQPNIEGLREMYQENYDEMHQGFIERNQTRVEAAKNNLNNKPQ